MASETRLPEGFAHLEQWVADWVLPDAAARMAKRQASAIEEIRPFYQSMLENGEAALAYLRGFALGSLPPDGERLLRLMLMLAEVAPAVEWYNSPHIYDGFPIERLRYLRQISDTAAQG